MTILKEGVKDPRRGQGQRYTLSQLFTMIILSNMCGYLGGRPAAKFSKNHASTLRDLLSLKYGTPSHVVFSDIMNRVDENELINAFNKWTSDYVPLQTGDDVSGDGKALRSPIKDGKGSGQKFQAVVSIFCQQSGLVYALKQYQNSKESEINVVQFLVQKLKDMEITLFLDALHAQKNCRNDC